MIDFQYQPNTDDKNSELRHAMDAMDGELRIRPRSFLALNLGYSRGFTNVYNPRKNGGVYPSYYERREY